LNEAHRASVEHQLLPHLSLRPGARVLDVGAGDGVWAEMLASIVGPTGLVRATNVNEGHHALAQERLNKANLNRPPLELVLHEAYHYETLGKEFDLVWVARITQSWAYPIKGIEGLRSLLRPGGRLALFEGSTYDFVQFPWPAGFNTRLVALQREFFKSEAQKPEVDSERYLYAEGAESLKSFVGKAGFVVREIIPFQLERLLSPGDNDALEVAGLEGYMENMQWRLKREGNLIPTDLQTEFEERVGLSPEGKRHPRYVLNFANPEYSDRGSIPVRYQSWLLIASLPPEPEACVRPCALDVGRG
jgi:ubiquinone/menaquinone biosynthesis C-methylase UbiE